MKIRKVIVREHSVNEPVDNEHLHEPRTEPEKWDEDTSESPRDVFGKALKAMSGYDAYVKKHGDHFTNELAEWATQRMENGTGDTHHWSAGYVMKAFARMGLQKPEDKTWGDAMYSANMHYADYFKKSLPTEQDCLKQAYAELTDVDGYPGQIFSRWCADMVKKKVDVPWNLFT